MIPLRLQVIACPVFQRELELLAGEAKTALTFRHLEMSLHEGAGGTLRAALQAAVDEVQPGRCDAIVIAYGLCNRGIVGLQARSLPVVIPRAHDCIGMLLGGTRSYLRQLELQPGTYFQSAGWLEHLPAGGDIRPQMSFGPGYDLKRDELVAKYGEENADYLIEEFTKFTQHYERLAFISTPVPEVAKWEAAARQTAQTRRWKFERLTGDLGWLRRLVNGEWNQREFLTLQPRERVVLRSDDLLIGAEAFAGP
jgi:hypothetical protein